MKKVMAILAALAALAALFGCGAASGPRRGYTRYTDADNLYTVDFPSGWNNRLTEDGRFLIGDGSCEIWIGSIRPVTDEELVLPKEEFLFELAQSFKSMSSDNLVYNDKYEITKIGGYDVVHGWLKASSATAVRYSWVIDFDKRVAINVCVYGYNMQSVPVAYEDTGDEIIKTLVLADRDYFNLYVQRMGLAQQMYDPESVKAISDNAAELIGVWASELRTEEETFTYDIRENGEILITNPAGFKLSGKWTYTKDEKDVRVIDVSVETMTASTGGTKKYKPGERRGQYYVLGYKDGKLLLYAGEVYEILSRASD